MDARKFFSSFCDVLGGYQGVAMKFCVVARELLCVCVSHQIRQFPSVGPPVPLQRVMIRSGGSGGSLGAARFSSFVLEVVGTLRRVISQSLDVCG